MSQSHSPSIPPIGTTGRLLFLCVLVGAVAGVGAIGFYWLLEASSHFFLDYLAGYRPEGPAGEQPLIPETDTPFRPWVLLILPAIGGLLSGLFVYRFAPEAAGHGTDAAIESYHFRAGSVRARVPLVKAIASAITIGTGGSGGREGPIAQIGAGFGSIIATRLNLSRTERRALVAAGMAAGIGAIFHAPLAGALFAAEVLYREMDLEYEVLVPSFIASIVAYSIFAVKYGWSPVFSTPEFVFQNPAQLLPYLVLAVVVALGAMVYTRVFYGVHNGFERLKVPRWLKPALGGLVVGGIGWFVPDALGAGYGVLQKGFTSELSITFLLVVAGAKIVTTAFSIGSGGSGGVFGPAVVIGGALGGAVGLIMQQLLPNLGLDPGAFVLVAMAGFFAAAANCPISTIIMVSEMTGNYHLLVPSMFVCVLAYLFTRRFTLYEKQLPSRLDAPSKMGNMLSAVLGKIPIQRAISGEENFATFQESTGFRQIVKTYAETDQSCFPILDDAGKLIAVIHDRDIRHVIDQAELADLVVARDLSRKPQRLPADASLLDALRHMTVSGLDALVLVDPGDTTRAVGVLSHEQLVRAYDQEVLSASD